MHPLAQRLNDALAGTLVGECLSDYGRRIYFPEGIVAQANEAGKLASRYNATVGMAYQDGQPMILPTVQDNLPRLTPMEAVGYAPTSGNPKLRSIWKEGLLKKNPALNPDRFTLPAVTVGITGALALAGELFCSPGDAVFYPELSWDNYDLLFETRFGARVHHFDMFLPDGRLNVTAVAARILDTVPAGGKALLVLNYPHNPTGYSPTTAEAELWLRELTRVADSGRRLVVILDDAYFGLAYEEDVYPSSLFNLLCGAHRNLLAIKCDGATKEDYVWGFRVGFFTLGAPDLTPEVAEATEAKIKGALRASVSSGPQVAQSILYKELTSLVYHGIKANFAEELRRRYREVRRVLARRTTGRSLKELPFNSGYFMCFDTGSLGANDLRKALLTQEGIGTIALGDRYLRVTFASVDSAEIEPLYRALFETADRLSG